MVTGLIIAAATIGVLLVIITVLDQPIIRERRVPQIARPKKKRRTRERDVVPARKIEEPTRVRASWRLLLALLFAATSGAALVIFFLRWIAGLLKQALS